MSNNSSSPSSSSALPDALEALHELTHAIRAHLHRPRREDANAPPPMEARALGFFMRHPGATQTDLVAHSGRDKAQVARLIKSLIERGLLKAEANPQDGRSLCLRPTEEGLAECKAFLQERRRLGKQLVQGLSAEQLAGFQAVITHMRANLDKD
ncbi:MarR family transcriptional regulator [Niveibacterium sp. SC-1]|uniref:MarR family winged helix-turn-helix transcriptional regulator n=1 Tax=Niveibacterium sp. SC-1 TaxID=3135646 RepID=UPI00311EA96C